MSHPRHRQWAHLAARGWMLGVIIVWTVWLVGSSHRAVAQSSQPGTGGEYFVRLAGHVHRLARPQDDLGEAPASLRMTGLELTLGRTAAQTQALKTLIADQQNPRSPQFHHWLTSAEFGARFGASDATIAAVSRWLESQGLKIGTIPAGRDYLPFSGTKPAVEAAFRTQIHLFSINGERHYSNIIDPGIPATFGSVISTVRGLNDFYPKPSVKLRAALAATRAARSSQPSFYIPGAVVFGYLIPGFVGPADAANIYDLTPLYANNVTGKGVTVAITAQSDINPSVLSAYWSTLGVNQSQSFTSIPVPPADGGSDPGQTNDGNEDEAYLDTEIIGGLAPGASLLLVRDVDATISAQYIIDEDTQASGGGAAGATSAVGIMNMSFSQCEADEGAANTAINDMFMKAATEGITVTVSSGDAGANQVSVASTPGCMSPYDEGYQGDVASAGLAANALASTPYTLAVGGTDFDPNLEGRYWNDSNTGAGSYSASAHVPEMAWSDSCGNAEWSVYFTGSADTLAFCNEASFFDPPYGEDIANPFIEILGGGGGISSCTSLTNTGACAGGYPQPAWQQNVLGISSFGGRALPDVSAIAARWLFCSYEDTDCTSTDFYAAWGTSTAAPTVAAIIALVDQTQQAGAAYADGRQGQMNPILYQIAGAEYGSAANLTACNASQGPIANTACVFYDVTLGSNAQPCAVATFTDTGSAPASSCDTGGNGSYATGLMTASSADNPGSYPAGQGYDLASGLGSIDAANLAAALTALGAPTGLRAAAHGASVQLTWTADASATSFNVYQGTASGQEAATPVATGVSGSSSTISGLQNAQTYFFEVAAVTEYGVSATSNEVSAMTVPAAPQGVTVTSHNAAGSLTVSWMGSSGAQSYSLFQGTSSGGEGNTAAQSGISGTTASISGLTAGQQYFFTVTAVDSGGPSSPSAEASGTVIPAVPTGLSATAGNGTVNLTWSAVTGATGYNIYEGTASGGAGGSPIQSSTSAASAISGLSDGATYYFTVAAVDAGGVSAQSAEVSATPTSPGGGGSTDGWTVLALGALGSLCALRRASQCRSGSEIAA